MKIWAKSPTDEIEVAKRQLEHAAMRRALYEMLWELTHPATENARARPCLSLSDRDIQLRLKELICD